MPVQFSVVSYYFAMKNLYITVITLTLFSALSLIQAVHLRVNDAHQQFRTSNLDWNNEVTHKPQQFYPQEHFIEQEEEIQKDTDTEQTSDDYPAYSENENELEEEDISEYDYLDSMENELENSIRRKFSHKHKRYEFTARVFNVNFSTSLENALEKNGKQIELSNKITIPNLSSAQLEYKCSVKEAREQYYEMSFTNTLTQFRRVYFEFTPPFFSHWENYEEPKLERARKVHTVKVKEYQMDATVVVPAKKCVEVSFLLDWIDNFHTRFNSIMEISGVVFKNSRKGPLIQVPLTSEVIEKMLKKKGITFIKPHPDEYVSNGKSLYVRLSGELRATFGATAYMSAADIACPSFNKTNPAESTSPQLQNYLV